MEKEKQVSLVRNILWGVLLVAALALGLVRGRWTAFAVLAVLFVGSKGAVLIGLLRLRKATNELQEKERQSGRSTFIPKPGEIAAMTSKADAIAEEINKLCPPRPCLKFVIDPELKPSVCSSKLGGTPYWNPAEPYPTDAKGRPMAMVVQVNFGQCPHVGLLPQEGMLQLFISSDPEVVESGYGFDFDNPTSQANCRVVYHEQVDRSVDEKVLRHYPRCEDLEYAPVLGEYGLRAEAALSCINHTCKDFDGLFADAVRKLYGDELDTPYYDDYLRRALPEEQRMEVDDSQVVGDNPMYQGPSEESFQMLGFPAFEQVDFRPEDSPYDTLLLQIPTIEAPEGGHWRTIWGDCGSARLFVNSADLRRRDFSKVYFDEQCY